MNNTRVVVLTAILIVCLLLMGWTVYQKQLLASRPPAPPIVVNLSPESDKPEMPSIKLDSIPDEPSALPVPDNSRSAFIFTTSGKGLGRVDPFIKLPVEFITAVLTGTNVTAPVGPPEPIVRGIVMSGNPFAYIEDGPGPYRKVHIGDFLAGGRIVAITERTVTVNRNGARVIFRLGV